MTTDESLEPSCREVAVNSILKAVLHRGKRDDELPMIALAILEVADAIREVAATQNRFGDIMQKRRVIAKEAPRRVAIPDGDSFAEVEPGEIAVIKDWASEPAYPTRIILRSGERLYLKSSIADVRAALAAAEEPEA